MNKWLIGLVVLCLPVAGMSQQGQPLKYSITGRLIDSATSNPVPYATVILSDTKQNMIASVYSGESGVFKLAVEQKGDFRLEITSVGYAGREMALSVSGKTAAITLDNIYLSSAGSNLAGVTVTARKRLIEQRPGMLVYNAENDVTNKGGTAADVLRKAPVLNVDAQGNVSMRGNSNLKILINGKYSGQIARSPADALNMMPAEIIKSVEVITTPSAKYDAEGAAGVINIITKKGRKNITGALELSASNLEQMFNPRISITKDKWSFSVHGHLHRYRIKEDASTERVRFENGSPVSHLSQQMEKDNAAPHGSADIAFVFAQDSVTELSFGSNLWFGNWPDDNRLETTIRTMPGGSIIENYSQYTDAAEKYLGSDINLGYNKKLKRPGREITLLAQFTSSRSRTPYQFWQTDKGSDLVLYREKNSNKTNNQEWTMQADYLHPLGKKGVYTLETGVKMIWREVSNEYDISVADGQGGSFQHDPARSDHFKYSQRVIAGYGMLKASLEKNWYGEAGLRWEQTRVGGNLLRAGNHFKSIFDNLVPTATLSKKITTDQTMTVSYTQRLTRPYIWDLNPNADASDPKNIIIGNPALQPEIAKQAELTYGWNKGSDFFLNTAIF